MKGAFDPEVEWCEHGVDGYCAECEEKAKGALPPDPVEIRLPRPKGACESFNEEGGTCV